MNTQARIEDYISGLSPSKGQDLRALHQRILSISPDCKLWFLDGRNSEGKVVSNPNIGYGSQRIAYADGGVREFYRIGLSANTSGVSVYVMGLEDRELLARTYGDRIGKAKVTGYCIKFRSLADIHVDVLGEIVADRMADRT